MRTQFNQDFIPIQQKGHRIPVHLRRRGTKQNNRSKTHCKVN